MKERIEFDKRWNCITGVKRTRGSIVNNLENKEDVADMLDACAEFIRHNNPEQDGELYYLTDRASDDLRQLPPATKPRHEEE